MRPALLILPAVAATAGLAAVAPGASSQPVDHHGRTAPPRATNRAAHPRRPAPTYRVVGGDNLSTLAVDGHTTVAALARLNRITDINRLMIGQVLRLPAGHSIPVHPGIAYVPPSPPAPAVRHATASSTPAAPTSSAASTAPSSLAPSSSFEQCVIARESGGNPDITNASGHWGLFQFSYSTWVANGGDPATFGSASAAEQESVFARSAPSNWTPYDGC